MGSMTDQIRMPMPNEFYELDGPPASAFAEVFRTSLSAKIQPAPPGLYPARICHAPGASRSKGKPRHQIFKIPADQFDRPISEGHRSWPALPASSEADRNLPRPSKQPLPAVLHCTWKGVSDEHPAFF
jgi:hypothetical protein